MQKAYPTNRKILAIGLTLGLVALAPVSSVFAENGIVAREAARRAAAIREAERLLQEGRTSYAKGEYEEAVQDYTEALNTLPGGFATQDRRRVIQSHLADGTVALAQKYRRTGRYAEARDRLESVLTVDPTNQSARQELSYLDDPIRTNPGLTYEHTQDVDEVRRLLYTAEGYMNLGLFDEALAEYHKVLRIDPYNRAARRGREKVHNKRADYYRSAYDETRAELLTQVDAAWEMAVPPAEDVRGPDVYGDFGRGGGGIESINFKLDNIILPVVDFERTTVEDAISFLRMRAREFDTFELDPEKKGINFVVRSPRIEGATETLDEELEVEGGLAGGPGERPVENLKLRNVPLRVALQYICDNAKLRYKVDEHAVTLLPLGAAEGEDIMTRTWKVPPTFLSDLESGTPGGAEVTDPFATEEPGGGLLEPRRPLTEILKDVGIGFPPGASAKFLPGSSTLIVTNTPTNLDLVDQLVEESIIGGPKMIKITTKYVEVQQENTDELSFDWIVTPFGLGSISDDLFLGGGTIGSGTSRTASDFVSPVGFVDIPGIPAGPNEQVSNIATAGLRSGDAAVTRNNIDAILNNPDRSAQNQAVAPGILHLTGLFSEGQFQMIMRGLAQKKGADLMTAPSVVTRPGQRATIEIIREFIYPTEYEPPELPNSVGVGFNQGGDGGFGGGGGSFPVTPATPTAFETRNTGVTLEIEPNVGANEYVIDVRFAPEIVEFEGFINFGSPITTPATDAFGNPVNVTVTENRIEMPVFSSRRVNTAVTIYDGHTVAVGGLIREDVQDVEDKVPLLGDIPLIGRLFQSSATNHIKSNLMIFVTAQIIDATGRPLRPPGAPADFTQPEAIPTPELPAGAGVLPRRTD